MKKALDIFHKYYFPAGLAAAFCLALLLRIVSLSSLPNFLHADEAALGYNAWCLAHFGVDRYLNEMPIYPQNYYGGQSPLYTYLTALLIRIGGGGELSLFLERLPSLIFNMLGLVFSVKTVHLIFHDKRLTLACSFLTAVLPYLIMQGRVGLDCNLMFGCCSMAVYLTAKYISTRKTSYLCLCGAAYGLVMYSYAMSYLFVPLCLILLALYMLYVRKINLPKTLLWALIVCIASLPILLFIFCLLFKTEPFQFLCFHIYPVASSRMTEIDIQGFFPKIGDAVKTTLTYDSLIVNSIPKYGTLYYLSLPFIVAGFLVSAYHFAVSIRKRSFHYSALFFLYYIACLITMGFVGVNVYRANFFFVAYIYFLILGLRSVCLFMQSYRRLFIAALTGGYVLWALSFIRFYFKVYALVVNTAMYLNPYYFAPPLEAVRFAETQLHSDLIYVDSELQETLLFCDPVSPYEWAESQKEDDTGYGYGHYRFNVNFETPISPDNAYIALKENIEFITEINKFDMPHETLDYGYYYLFYFTGQR